MFVGTERGLETTLVPQAGLPLELIRVTGLKGMGGMKFVRNAAMLPAGLWDSEKVLSAIVSMLRSAWVDTLPVR